MGKKASFHSYRTNKMVKTTPVRVTPMKKADDQAYVTPPPESGINNRSVEAMLSRIPPKSIFFTFSRVPVDVCLSGKKKINTRMGIVVSSGTIQNTQRQELPSTTAPPRNGPTPLPRAITAPSQPAQIYQQSVVQDT
jgi:hypothetical protein